jgi:hypothetical protein
VSRMAHLRKGKRKKEKGKRLDINSNFYFLLSTFNLNLGDIAQLVERLPCTHEVRSSNLLISTKLPKTDKSKSKKLATHLVRQET